MILRAKNKAELDKHIDAAYGPQTSIVLRYRNVFRFHGSPRKDAGYKKWLQKTSIREGARIFPLLNYRGVEIYILDTTSLMHTKTLKALDGCITTAHCKERGYKTVVFESGGNTGAALTGYGLRAGLETFLFLPEENLPLLNSRIFESRKAHLITVKDPKLTKKAAHLFAKDNNLKHIPELSWRYESSMFRGLFILEYMLKNLKFDWLTQTVSAAFGPIGIYGILKNFKKELKTLPRFLGVQQQANCPMVKFWRSKGKTIGKTGLDSTGELLTKVMYDIKPQTYGTYKDLVSVLVSSHGDMTTINHAEFSDFLRYNFGARDILDLFKAHGIVLTANKGDIVEKTGLMALAGTFKEINSGKIARGSRVLCCLTSGVSEADGKAKPEYRISDLKDIKRLCRR